MPEEIYNPTTSSTPQGQTFELGSLEKQPVSSISQPKGKPPAKLKTIIAIIIIILVLGILAVAFIFAAYPKYFKKNTNKSNIVNQTNQAVNIITNFTNQVATNTPTNININKVLPSNLDNDHDGLTNLEEEALTTDRQNPDTDGDGYSDSNEVENGYNPIGAGFLNTTAGLYKSYTDKEFSYHIYYPLNFQMKKDELSRKIEFLAPTDEIIDIVIEDVPSNITSALDLYLSKNPDIDKTIVKTIKNWYNDLEGVLSTDGKSAYYLKGNKAFIITYHFAEKPSYGAIFEMVYHSLKPVILAETNVNAP